MDNHPDYVTGPPNYLRGPRRKRHPPKRTIYSLGCHGSATWEFIDNVIVDIPGPDIFVFEIGKSKEPTRVEISENGSDWIDVGIMKGAKSTIDIAGRADPTAAYRFVRLTDLGKSCRGKTAGADIDAIAAIAFSWTLIEDDSATVFFEFGADDLTEPAQARLTELFTQYRDLASYRLQIVGHTDWIGSGPDNQQLSENRAESVRDFIVSEGWLDDADVTALGRGKEKPVATNSTSEGRAANRRVELTFIPRSPCP